MTSSLMLHHLPDDLKRAGLAEIRRVLKPGGRADKLAPMLKGAGIEVEVVATRHKTFAFIRAR